MEDLREKLKPAELEALLFYYGEPITVKKAAKILGVSDGECLKILAGLEESLKNDPNRGLGILRNGNEFQLVTKPEFAEINQKLIKEEFREELTPASLETLSLIAYLGPVPRSTIDYIRGVNSSFILRNLLIRGLIERNLEAEKGNVYYYEVSFKFLTHLGLSRREDLPDYERYKNILNEFATGEAAPNEGRAAPPAQPITPSN